MFLTPHIIRSPEDLEFETIRKREEFADSSKEGLEWSDRERAVERKRQKAAEEAGEEVRAHRATIPCAIAVLEARSPLPGGAHRKSRPQRRAHRASEAEAARLAALHAHRNYAVQALVGGDVDEAIDIAAGS